MLNILITIINQASNFGVLSALRTLWNNYGPRDESLFHLGPFELLYSSGKLPRLVIQQVHSISPRMSRLTAHLLLTPLVHGRKSSLRLCRVAKPLNKWVVQSQWILKTGEERWTTTLVCEPSSTSEGNTQ